MGKSITIDKQGRRFYLLGDTFSIKAQLADAGCHFDRDQRAWWTSKREVAEQFSAAEAPQSATSTPVPSSDRPAPGGSAIVAGRATYKGKTYYVLGRKVRGRTHWDDTVTPIQTRDGSKLLLSFRDGSKSFWASTSEAKIVKVFQKGKTIDALRKFAEESRAQGGGIPAGRSYVCEECGERVVSGDGSSCWETGCAH